MSVEWIVVGAVWGLLIVLGVRGGTILARSGRELDEYLRDLYSGSNSDPQIRPLLAGQGVSPAAVEAMVRLKGQDFASKVSWPRLVAQLGVYVGLCGTVIGLTLTAWSWQPSTTGSSELRSTQAAEGQPASAEQSGGGDAQGQPPATDSSRATGGFAVAFVSALGGVLATILVSWGLHRYDERVDELERELTKRALARLSVHDTASVLAEQMKPVLEELIARGERTVAETKRVADEALTSMQQTHREAVQAFASTLADQSRVVEEIRQGVEAAAGRSVELMGRLSESVSRGLDDVGKSFGEAAARAASQVAGEMAKSALETQARAIERLEAAMSRTEAFGEEAAEAAAQAAAEAAKSALEVQTRAIGRLEDALARTEAFGDAAAASVARAAQTAADEAAKGAVEAQKQAVQHLREALLESQAQSDEFRRAVAQLAQSSGDFQQTVESVRAVAQALDGCASQFGGLVEAAEQAATELRDAGVGFESIPPRLRDLADVFVDKSQKMLELQQSAAQSGLDVLAGHQQELARLADEMRQFLGLALSAIYDAPAEVETGRHVLAGTEKFEELMRRLEELRQEVAGRPMAAVAEDPRHDPVRPLLDRIDSVQSSLDRLERSIHSLERASRKRRPFWKFWHRETEEA